MTGALCSTLGTRGYSETQDGDAKSLKKMGIVDGGGLRGLCESALELTIFHRKLFNPMCGSQSAVAPRGPTPVDFFVSLPEATTVFATTHSPLFPDIARLLDSTEILAFLSSHRSRPIDRKQAIHRVCRTGAWRLGTLVEGTNVEGYALGNQLRRKCIVPPFRLFYSLA
jgi:hypothetical protein